MDIEDVKCNFHPEIKVIKILNKKNLKKYYCKKCKKFIKQIPLIKDERNKIDTSKNNEENNSDNNSVNSSDESFDKVPKDVRKAIRKKSKKDYIIIEDDKITQIKKMEYKRIKDNMMKFNRKIDFES